MSLDALITIFGPRFANLTPARPALVQEELARHPGMPADYAEFLLNIGWGEIEGSIMLYEGLMSAKDVAMDHWVPPGRSFLFFGDNMGGISSGFDTKTWTVVWLDSAGGRLLEFPMSFTEYLLKNET